MELDRLAALLAIPPGPKQAARVLDFLVELHPQARNAGVFLPSTPLKPFAVRWIDEDAPRKAARLWSVHRESLEAGKRVAIEDASHACGSVLVPILHDVDLVGVVYIDGEPQAFPSTLVDEDVSTLCCILAVDILAAKRGDSEAERLNSALGRLTLGDLEREHLM